MCVCVCVCVCVCFDVCASLCMSVCKGVRPGLGSFCSVRMTPVFGLDGDDSILFRIGVKFFFVSLFWKLLLAS